MVPWQAKICRPYAMFPFSPLSESPLAQSNNELLETVPPPAFRLQPKRFSRVSASTENVYQGLSAQNRNSLASASSRYDSPISEFSDEGPPTRFRPLQQQDTTADDPFTESGREDDEWMTDRSASRSSRWRAQQYTEDRDMLTRELLLDRQVVTHEFGAASGLAPPSRGQDSERSGTNSLRFL